MNTFAIGVELERLRFYLRNEAKSHAEYRQREELKDDADSRRYHMEREQVYVVIAMKVEHLIRKMSGGAA